MRPQLAKKGALREKAAGSLTPVLFSKEEE